MGRLCAPFRLAVPFLLPLPLLLQCAWSSRYNPAKGQPGRQAGRHKKSSYSFEATSYEDVDDMEDDMEDNDGLGDSVISAYCKLKLELKEAKRTKRNGETAQKTEPN